MAETFKGRKVYVSTTAQNADLADATAYGLLTWVEIGNVGNVTEMGTTTNFPKYDDLSTIVSQKGKGVSDAGNPTIEVARNDLDAGQILMRSYGAPTDENAYAFKITDKPVSGFSPRIHYNRGKVAGPTRPNGRVEDFNVEVFTLALEQQEIIVNAAALVAPANVVLPAISGLADASGSILTAYVGTWNNYPASYAYQWQRDVAGNGVWSNIGGATNQTYDPVDPADVGNALRVGVTATNAAGSTQAFSAPTQLVIA